MQALAAQAEATLKLTHNVGGAASFLEVATSEEPGVLLERTSYCVKCVVAYFVFFSLLFVWFRPPHCFLSFALSTFPHSVRG